MLPPEIVKLMNCQIVYPLLMHRHGFELCNILIKLNCVCMWALFLGVTYIYNKTALSVVFSTNFFSCASNVVLDKCDLMW